MMKHGTQYYFWYAAVCLLLGTVLASGETFSGSVLVRPSWTHEKTNGLATTVSERFPSTFLNWDFTSGTGANQMNQLWNTQVTLTNSEAVTYDLAGGITNSFGTVLTVAEVRVLLVSSDSDNLNAVSIGGAASNPFAAWAGDSSDTLSLRPGGIVVLIAPDATAYAVSTNGNLKITNDGTNAVTLDVYVGGSDQ